MTSATPNRAEYRFPRRLWTVDRVVSDTSAGAESEGEGRVLQQWEEL